MHTSNASSSVVLLPSLAGFMVPRGAVGSSVGFRVSR